MVRFGQAGVFAVVFGLGGCATTVTPSQYSAYRQSVVGSPIFRTQEIAKCVNGQAELPLNTRTIVAAIVHLPLEKSSLAICRRMVEAIASGRIDYEGYRKIMSGGVDGETVKILQGR